MPKVNIANIKTQIKSILDTANTTTGSPINLSLSMNKAVQRVMKIHPARIPIQASLYPYVTIFLEDKELAQLTVGIGGSQTNALRVSELNLSIVGACFEPFFSDFDEDQGSENSELLMENIEEILRANPTLNSTVSWAIPSAVTYDEVQFSEDVHLRAGLMTLKCKVHY